MGKKIITCSRILFWCCCLSATLGEAQAGFSSGPRQCRKAITSTATTSATGSIRIIGRRWGQRQQLDKEHDRHHRDPVDHLCFQPAASDPWNGINENDSISSVSRNCYQRRQVLRSWTPRIVGLTALSACEMVCMPSSAVAASTSSNIKLEDSKLMAGGGGAAGESLRRSASNIPGLGPADIYYPESLVGSWNMTRQVVLNEKENTILTLNYPIRFLSSLDAKGQAAAVMDRGFNQAALENALRSGVPSSSLTTTPANVVQSYTWSASNPNDLRIFFTNGSSKEIKVTKRAATTTSTMNDSTENTSATTTTIDSSEFQRVTLDDQTVPVISARRVLTKWKSVMEDNDSVNNNVVEGLELVYDMSGSVSDPLASFANQQQPQQQTPKLLSKSRLRITRSRP
jgi:hypothetical protein